MLMEDEQESWFEDFGNTILLVVALIVTRQFRGLHTHKVDEMVASILHGTYIASSVITVQIVDGVYFLVDGLHRVTAVLECIRRGKLPPGFKVKAVVMKQDTPAHILIAYSAKVNEDNKNSMIMTFTDKLRWYAYYIASIVVEFEAQDKAKKYTKKRVGVAIWSDVTPEYAAGRMKIKGKSPDNFALSTVEKLSGVLKCIRETLFVDDEVHAPLTQTSTAYTDLLVLDQLGAMGLAGLYACFALSYPPGEKKGPVVPTVPFKHSKENPGKWYHPHVISISNSYPKIFTLGEPTPLEQELAFDQPRNRLLMRMFIAYLVRTGTCATKDDATAWVKMLAANPRIVWLWGKLKAIAEPTHRMAETALGFALMAEQNGQADYTQHENGCECTCHDLHLRSADAELWLARADKDSPMPSLWSSGHETPACNCGVPHFAHKEGKKLTTVPAACHARFVVNTLAKAKLLAPGRCVPDEKTCAYVGYGICLTAEGFAHTSGDTALHPCSRGGTNCPHMMCMLCLLAHHVAGEPDSCLVCTVTRRGKQLPPWAGHVATLHAVVQRFPSASSPAKIISFLNPHSYNTLENAPRKRQAQAGVMMRMIELGYVDMVDPTWGPLAAMEVFLAADNEVKDEDGDGDEAGGLGDLSSNDAYAGGSHRQNRFGSGAEPRHAAPAAQVVVAVDPAAEEEKLMFSALSRELMAYDANKASVVVVCMSWQDYYDKSQSSRAGPDKLKLPVAQFIHVDPWYDLSTLDADDAEKFRKLIDRSSEPGTKLIVWSTFGGLHRWSEMLQGVFITGASTRWEVEPTPIVVVRHASRNRQAHRGNTLRRNCEFALIATRVAKTAKKSNKRDLEANNNNEQLEALALPALPHLPKLSANSNVILEYKPPTKKERLKDSKGKALRKLAEKAVSLTAQLLARWTVPGDTVLDLFSGSSGMAVALIALGRGRKYVGVDNDPDIMDAVHARIGRAHLLRAQQQTEMNTSLARLVSFQSLASAQHSFLLPAHNIPVTMLNGKDLAMGGPHNNLDWVLPDTASRFEIKESQVTANGLQMGEGLFLRENAVPIEAGTEVPELYFFGTFVEFSQLDGMYPDGVPGYPGVFQLRPPVAEYSLVLDERCPAAKINDARGSPCAYT